MAYTNPGGFFDDYVAMADDMRRSRLERIVWALLASRGAFGSSSVAGIFQELGGAAEDRGRLRRCRIYHRVAAAFYGRAWRKVGGDVEGRAGRALMAMQAAAMASKPTLAAKWLLRAQEHLYTGWEAAQAAGSYELDGPAWGAALSQCAAHAA